MYRSAGTWGYSRLRREVEEKEVEEEEEEVKEEEVEV